MLLRHRVTVLNHDSSVEVLKDIDEDHIEFNDVAYDREDRFTVDMIFLTVDSLRIHYGEADSKVFNYHNNRHLNIYIKPTTATKDRFDDEIGRFLKARLGLENVLDKFIFSGNSLYLHLQDFDPSVFEYNLSGLLQQEIHAKALDFAFENSVAMVSYVNEDREPVQANDNYVEVGIFNIDENSEPADIVLSGVRAVLSDGANLEKTLIHVAPKYRETTLKAEVSLVENGLHPKFAIKLDAYPPHKTCDLYYYLTLDKALFVDEHNLGDGTLVVNFGPKDIELPEYEIRQWGNELMVQIPRSKFHSTVELNLHLRYRLPNATAITLESPLVFFSCDEDQVLSLIDQSPFIHRSPVGGNYEAFFTPSTSFYRLNKLEHFEIDPPTLNAGSHISTISITAVALGLLLVLFQAFRPKASTKPGASKNTDQTTKTKAEANRTTKTTKND